MRVVRVHEIRAGLAVSENTRGIMHGLRTTPDHHKATATPLAYIRSSVQGHPAKLHRRRGARYYRMILSAGDIPVAWCRIEGGGALCGFWAVRSVDGDELQRPRAMPRGFPGFSR